jgi:hypothetical protein
MRNPVSTLRFTEIELLTDRDYIDDAIELYLVGTSPDGRRHIANLSGLEWKTPASGEYTRDRALNLPSKEALRFLSAFIVAGGKLGLRGCKKLTSRFEVNPLSMLDTKVYNAVAYPNGVA